MSRPKKQYVFTVGYSKGLSEVQKKICLVDNLADAKLIQGFHQLALTARKKGQIKYFLTKFWHLPGEERLHLVKVYGRAKDENVINHFNAFQGIDFSSDRKAKIRELVAKTDWEKDENIQVFYSQAKSLLDEWREAGTDEVMKTKSSGGFPRDEESPYLDFAKRSKSPIGLDIQQEPEVAA